MCVLPNEPTLALASCHTVTSTSLSTPPISHSNHVRSQKSYKSKLTLHPSDEIKEKHASCTKLQCAFTIDLTKVVTLADETTEAEAAKDSATKEPTSKPLPAAHLPSRQGELVLLSSDGTPMGPPRRSPTCRCRPRRLRPRQLGSPRTQPEPSALPAKKAKRARPRTGKENAGKSAQLKPKVRKVTKAAQAKGIVGGDERVDTEDDGSVL